MDDSGEQNWSQRMKGACVGMVIGFFAVIIAVCLLWWNEFNYVHNTQILDNVSKSVVKLPPDACNTLNIGNNGHIVYASCPISGLWDFSKDKRLGDLPQLFGNSADEQSFLLTAAWIKADSLIFQWDEDKECEKKSDGHGGKTEECTYTYQKRWANAAIDSTQFQCNKYGIPCKDSSGYPVKPDNAGSVLPAILNGQTFAPDNGVVMGIFGLNGEMLHNLQDAEPMPQGGNAVKTVTVVPGHTAAKWSDGTVTFRSNTTGQDSIGDVSTTFSRSVVHHAGTINTLSAVAQQQSRPSFPNMSSLIDWDTGMPGTMRHVNWAVEGHVSFQQLIDSKVGENQMTTFMLRILGWLVLFIGLNLITGPIKTFPEFMPCGVGEMIGQVIGCALCCLNFMLSVSLATVVIAIAWIAARPLVGVGLLVFAILVFVGALYYRKHTDKSARQVGPYGAASAQAFMSPSAPAV